MSASITPISTPTRRRQVLTATKPNKTTIELLNDALIPPIVNNNAPTTNVNKDPNSAKDVPKIRKPLQQSHPRRPRTSSVPPKSRMQTVVSVLTKNLLLLIVVLGLVQIVRNLVVNVRREGNGKLLGFEDAETRIAGVETMIKKATVMLQDEIGRVERRVDSELSGLRGEVDRKLSAEVIGSRLEGLDVKYGVLEKALAGLESRELLSKEDFGRLYEEFSRGKGGDLGYDGIMDLAREIVGREIERHAGDGVGRVDYALGSGGAMVVKHSEAFGGGKWLSSRKWEGVRSDAEKMLRPSFGEPGQCFALKGDSGFVEIKLRMAIVPEAITLEHVAKSVAYDRSSAPRDCRIYGWQRGQGLDTESAVDSEKMLITEFTYDLEKSNAQTFNVFDSASSAVIDTIRFDFRSNHGSPSHTCIYRVRVHGHEPNSLSVSRI